jgi:hypothetical protein
MQYGGRGWRQMRRCRVSSVALAVLLLLALPTCLDLRPEGIFETVDRERR